MKKHKKNGYVIPGFEHMAMRCQAAVAEDMALRAVKHALLCRLAVWLHAVRTKVLEPLSAKLA